MLKDRKILVVFILLACWFAPAIAWAESGPLAPASQPLSKAATKPAQIEGDPVTRMQEVINFYVKSNQFMGTVLVARGSDVLLNQGYGSANLEWNVPNTPDTKFRLGSDTKQFTAACILLLEERGQLKIDAPVKTYLSDAPAAWDKITIYNLLTHTSGIPSFTGFSDYLKTEALPTTPQKLVEWFRDKPLQFEPGTKWNYSNSGYVLLGYLIEKISGQSYAEFVKQNIFQPLGMKDSGYDSNSDIIARRAEGYVPGPNGPKHAPYVDMTVPYAAGALYSTTGDLLKWEQGLFTGQVVSAASLKKMTTPVKNGYAFAVWIEQMNGHAKVSHGGTIEGFDATLAYFPDDQVTVVVLANLNGAAGHEIARRLELLALGEPVTLPVERKEVMVSPKVLAAYAGSYELTPDIKLALTVEDGTLLMAQAAGGEKVPLFAESETKFFFKMVDVQVEFFRNDKGEVTHLVIHPQGGTDTKAVRK